MYTTEKPTPLMTEPPVNLGAVETLLSQVMQALQSMESNPAVNKGITVADVLMILEAAKVPVQNDMPEAVAMAAPSPEMEAMMTQLQAEKDAIALELEQAKAELMAAQEKEAAFSRAKAVTEAIAPTMKALAEKGYSGEVDALTALFSKMPLEAQEIEFSSAGEDVKQPASETLLGFLDRLPKRIHLGGEVAGGEVVQFSKADGNDWAKQIKQYQIENPGVSGSQAMAAIKLKTGVK